MKRLYPTVVLTGMLAVALSLSACSSWRANEGTSASGSSGAAGATGSSNGGSGARAADATTQPGIGSQSLGATGDPAAQAGAGAYPSGIQSGAAADQSGAVGASGASGATGTSDAQDQSMQRSAPPPVANTTPNSTVISIEPLASSSTGSSGASGTSGSTAGAEQAYRVTLRMDDGSTQVVSQATAPTYRSGDRVNLSSGVISR